MASRKATRLSSIVIPCCHLGADGDDEDWYPRAVVDEVVAHAAQYGAFDGAEAARPHTDEVGLLIVGHLEDSLSGVLHRLTRRLEADLNGANTTILCITSRI